MLALAAGNSSTTLTGGPVTNYGVLSSQAAGTGVDTLEIPVVTESGGTVEAQSGDLFQVDGDLTNKGILRVLSGASYKAQGTVTVTNDAGSPGGVFDGGTIVRGSRHELGAGRQ